MTFKKNQMIDLSLEFGGADRDRTDDLLNAIQALSQLSYGPTHGSIRAEDWNGRDTSPAALDNI